MSISCTSTPNLRSLRHGQSGVFRMRSPARSRLRTQFWGEFLTPSVRLIRLLPIYLVQCRETGPLLRSRREETPTFELCALSRSTDLPQG